jgi:hypothetical protein
MDCSTRKGEKGTKDGDKKIVIVKLIILKKRGG